MRHSTWHLFQIVRSKGTLNVRALKGSRTGARGAPVDMQMWAGKRLQGLGSYGAFAPVPALVASTDLICSTPAVQMMYGIVIEINNQPESFLQ